MDTSDSHASQTSNIWKPYDSACPPSVIMKDVPGNLTRRKVAHSTKAGAPQRLAVPVRNQPGSSYNFLFDRTILLQGARELRTMRSEPR